jgi:mitogen-activated protein kinase kinase kinase
MFSPGSPKYQPRQSSSDILGWNEKQVGEWLVTAGFGRYATYFSSNNITGETLLECSPEILRQLGVSKVGDRVKLNVAIKRLQEQFKSVVRSCVYSSV